MTNAQVRVRRRSDAWLPALLLLIAGLGWWFSTVTAGNMGTGVGPDGMSMRGASMSFAAFVLAWVAMIAAMMLPAVVEPETTEEQINCLAQIYTGQLGGDPWAILGTTYEVAGLVKAPITFDGVGVRASVSAEGLGQGSGETFKNPVTGEEHLAQIVLPDGFIWKKGECGVGSFEVEAEGIHLKYTDTNWIFYEFDWSN